MDAWLVRKSKELRDELDDHIIAGGDLKEPGYRDQLGQHRMIQRMRSYISSAKPTPPTRLDDGVIHMVAKLNAIKDATQ